MVEKGFAAHHVRHWIYRRFNGEIPHGVKQGGGGGAGKKTSRRHNGRNSVNLGERRLSPARKGHWLGCSSPEN